MDSEHRHELEENDLQEFLLNFREWWGRWGTYVLIVVALSCAAILIWITLSHRDAQARQSAWNDLATSNTPEILQKVASDHSLKTVKILASLRSADLYLAAYLKPAQKPASTQPNQNDLTPKQKLDHAQAMYRQVLSLADQPLFKINALMGLGSVAENRADWAQAKNDYQQAQTLAKQASFTNLAQAAAARIHYVAKIQTKLVFAPPAKQPASKPSATGASHPPVKPLPEKPAATQP